MRFGQAVLKRQVGAQAELTAQLLLPLDLALPKCAASSPARMAWSFWAIRKYSWPTSRRIMPSRFSGRSHLPTCSCDACVASSVFLRKTATQASQLQEVLGI